MENKEKNNPTLNPTQEPPKEEESVTLQEMFDDMRAMEDTADILFAAQDPSVCTFPEGYKPRQTVFTCLTCTPAPQMAGVCYGCSLNCHDGHDIVELYTKRKFRCDCGNAKFGDKKCTLYEEKERENEYNMYNHNYHGKFCSCDVFYPDDDKGTGLFQCEICEDWYHDEHAPTKFISFETDQTANDESAKGTSSAICTACIRKLPFVAHIPQGKDIICHSKLTPEQLSIEKGTELLTLMISNFRQKLCKCTDCVRVYEMSDCEYLIDDEDDMATFENASKAKVEAERTTDADEMRNLVNEFGMEGARVFYEGLNNFKRKFEEFIVRNGEGGKVITEEEVKKFTEELKDRKRPRHE